MKYSIRQLQLGYMAAKLEKENEGERCHLCWEKQCEHGSNIKHDPFINLTTVSEFTIK